VSDRKPPPRWSLNYQPNQYNGPNPLLREFFAELNKRRMSQEYLCHRIGMSRNTLREWKRNRGARMDRFAEALRFMGLKLAIVPLDKEETNATQRGKTLDPDRQRQGISASQSDAG
jgi:transcriptional regulator with XRE-family HTH domain